MTKAERIMAGEEFELEGVENYFFKVAINMVATNDTNTKATISYKLLSCWHYHGRRDEFQRAGGCELSRNLRNLEIYNYQYGIRLHKYIPLSEIILCQKQS